jgi:hypothetical protein
MYRARAIVSGINGGHGLFTGWLLAENVTPAISCATVRNYNVYILVPVASKSFLNGRYSQNVKDM